MSNPCGCCKRKMKFVTQMNGNLKHSMVIPEWFVDHFGGKISGTIKLEAPNGNVYDVAVTENMNGTVLQSGWEAFVDANHIEENYSLMFRYLGHSRFEVTVFDSNGREKILCCAGLKNASHVQKTSTYYVDMSSSSGHHTSQSSESEGSDECHRESLSRRGKQVKMAAISPPSEELSAEDCPSEYESLKSDHLQMLSKPNYKRSKLVTRQKAVFSGRCDLTEEQEAKIVALVRKIQPQIPVLVAMMKKTNVKPHPDLVISKEYAITYFPHESATVTLKLPGKSEKWQCKFCIRPDGGKRNLYLGDFVHDNRVREGDLCLFQPMTKGDAKEFTVTVHLLCKESIDYHPGGRTEIGSNHGSKRFACRQRGSSSHRRNNAKTAATSSSSEEEGEDSHSEYDSFESDDLQTPPERDCVLSIRSQLSGAQKEKVNMLLRKIQPETTVFVAIMEKSNVQLVDPNLVIAKEYAIAHFPHGSATITLHRLGKSKKWHPRFYRSNDRKISMLKGRHWLDFVRDNRVKEGDICLFVPTKDGGRFRFTVHLLHREQTHSRFGTGVQRVGSSHGRTNTWRASAVQIKEEPIDGENGSPESNRHGVSHESLESEDSYGPSEPSYILSSRTRSCLSRSQKKRLEERAQAIQSEVPIYVAILTNSNVGAAKRNTLEFCARYAAVHLPDKMQTMVLQCMGKIWKTNMVICNGNRRFLSRGWSKFVHDNCLRAGDICLFELKKKERNLTMMVHIQ